MMNTTPDVTLLPDGAKAKSVPRRSSPEPSEMASLIGHPGEDSSERGWDLVRRHRGSIARAAVEEDDNKEDAAVAAAAEKARMQETSDRALRKTLSLCVTWDAPSLAKTILSGMHTSTQEENEEVGTLRSVGAMLPIEPCPCPCPYPYP